jgi:hypothetical protein
MPKLTEWFIHAKLASQEDPIGVERFNFEHENGMKIINKTAALEP